jgi:hypothetical protein
MTKWSRLEVKKNFSPVFKWPSCFDHTNPDKKVRFSNGRNKMADSLNHFINKIHKKYFIHDKTV